jgi:hypothetical protein
MMREQFEALALTYLESNAVGRRDGALKANTHEAMCALFVSTYLNVSKDISWNLKNKDGKRIEDVVREGTRPFTDNIDDIIGFPKDTAPNYRKLTPRFVEGFLALATEIVQDDVTLLPDEELQALMEKLTKSAFSANLVKAMESYSFKFVDGASEGDNCFVKMRTVLGQELVVKPSKYFGCEFEITVRLSPCVTVD